MIELRALKRSDHARVRLHLAECWRETYAHHLEPSEIAGMVASLDEPDLGLLPADGVALVAVETEPGASEARIVGTAIAAARHGTGYVWGMYVAANKKRCGIGRLLLAEIAARLEGAARLSVIVLKASSEAEAFYLAQGFAVGETCGHELVAGKSVPASVLVWERARA